MLKKLYDRELTEEEEYDLDPIHNLLAQTCVDCGDFGDREHHLLPVVLGGKDGPTVYLCQACHAKAHGMKHSIELGYLSKVGRATAEQRRKQSARYFHNLQYQREKIFRHAELRMILSDEIIRQFTPQPSMYRVWDAVVPWLAIEIWPDRKTSSCSLDLPCGVQIFSGSLTIHGGHIDSLRRWAIMWFSEHQHRINSYRRKHNLTTTEMSSALSTSTEQLMTWRENGEGPPFIETDDDVIYPCDQFFEWMDTPIWNITPPRLTTSNDPYEPVQTITRSLVQSLKGRTDKGFIWDDRTHGLAVRWLDGTVEIMIVAEAFCGCKLCDAFEITTETGDELVEVIKSSREDIDAPSFHGTLKSMTSCCIRHSNHNGFESFTAPIPLAISIPTPVPDDLMTVREMYDTTDLGFKLLGELREAGKGPPFIMNGEEVFYSRNAVHEWVNSLDLRPRESIKGYCTRGVPSRRGRPKRQR